MATQETDANLDITVFRGFKETGKYIWSPFVIKLEARLRFGGVRYKTDVGSPRVGPKGKIPYIECRDLSASPLQGGKRNSSEQKVQLGDSTLIAKTLTEWGVLPDLSAGLDPSKKLQDLAVKALLEEKLYFFENWEHWIQHYYDKRDTILWSVPYPMRIIVGFLLYRSIAATLHGQGTGRFTAKEIEEFRHEIWETIGAQLVTSRSSSKGGDKEPFWILGGEQPTEADACLFGFIVAAWISTAGPKSRQDIKEFPVLLDYAGRIHERYFPDYEKWAE
ncbi:putative glutathione S-transferase [Daldinia caldariorum]|uniref:putative glutathione S-transferase n=1 Tax=Daldinia caldariorum TaxID=326644 RepID=UPI0020079CD6|nr:putative glutathione S-transferase [Daldinia caldariorum]KAI1470473.1 putative glutathione S-transferase [Daldinia caldariorum]